MGKKAAKTRSLPGEIVLVGCESAGKTVLCNHLEHKLSSPAIPEKKSKKAVAAAPEPVSGKTQPTIGVVLMDYAHRDCAFSVREAGGSMQPVWSQYLGKAKSVLFVADTASAEGLSGAVAELCDVLQQCPEIAVLLFLNKRDLPSALPEETVRLMLQLDELERIHAEWLTVVAGSALTGDGLDAVLDWCVDTLIAREELEAVVNEALDRQSTRDARRSEENQKLAAEINAAALAAAEGKDVVPPPVDTTVSKSKAAAAIDGAPPPKKKGFFGKKS